MEPPAKVQSCTTPDASRVPSPGPVVRPEEGVGGPAPANGPKVSPTVPGVPSPLPGAGSEEERVEPLPPKERIESPLDEELPVGREGREVSDYLAATAPILQDLSKLIARAPALAMEDYDPADPNASVKSRDLLIQMKAMIRDLQILDAKTFSVMPPVRYERFHLRIRESIIETHQACDAIIKYFNKRETQQLRKIHRHLTRVYDLIRRLAKRADWQVPTAEVTKYGLTKCSVAELR